MLRTIIAGLTCGYFAAWAADAAASSLEGPVPAKVERVIDGDTLAVRAHIWLDHEILVKVRLADIDAPELGRADCPAEKEQAQAAKRYLGELIADAPVILTDIRHDKYAGRVAARATSEAGVDLSAAMVEAGHALPDGADDYCPLY